MYQIKLKQKPLQPRERLSELGAENLSNHELLAILLRTGVKEKPVGMVAYEILEKLDYLAKLDELSLEELQQMRGIGPAKAVELKAMIELGKRINQSSMMYGEQILSSELLGKKLIREMKDKSQEHLVALYLNTQNQIIRQKTIFIGTINRSVAEPREILHYAVKYMANSVIIAHNHPSGSVLPSQNDQHFTRKLKESCETLGLHLLDHLIVGKDQYYSFREETDLV